MDYQAMAPQIIKGVGGRQNIDSVTFCTTRLRFKLNDPSLADDEYIKSIKGVIAVVKGGGQTQIVIGQQVKQAYEPINALLEDKNTVIDESPVTQSDSGLKTAKEKKAEMSSKKFTNTLFDTISGVFTPILGLLSATGILKGLLVFLEAMNILSSESGTYQILNIVANCFFTFMPIFLGYTSMKKFGGTPFIGMAIGAAFVFPTVSTIMGGEPLYTVFADTVFKTPVYIEFLGIPVILMDYYSSVFPVILTCWFASKVDRFLTAHLPDMIKFFAIPAITLLLSVTLGFLVIGPAATFIGNALGALVLKVYNLSPTLSGFLYGAFVQFLVIFGLHWGFIAVSINNLATLGYDAITVPGMASVFGQAGVILYIWIKTKNTNLKQVAGSSFISAIFGITEPGIYGVTLQNKRAFVIASIASGIGGAIMGFARTKLYVYGPGGVFGWLQVVPKSGIDNTVYATIIAGAVSFILAFVMMTLFGKYDDKDMEVG